MTQGLLAATCQIGADVTRPPTVERAVAAVRAAAAGGARLIVLPELAPSGCCFVDRAEAANAAESLDGPTVSALRELSAALSVTIVCGVALRDDSGVFNTAVAVEAGQLLGTYRKTHLWGAEKDQFLVGDQLPVVLDSRCGALALLVCYDLEFPELTRIAADSGAEIVAVPANWPVTNHPPDQLPIEVIKAQAAAAYYGVFVLVADRCATERGTPWVGGSVIVAPTGYLLAGPATAPGHTAEPGILFADINPHETRDKALGPYNDRILDRREPLYRLEHSANLNERAAL